VTEQFAFEQRLRDGRAVDGEEGRVRSAAVVVDRAGDQLFSRPTLAQDQDVDLLWRDPADRLAHLLHHAAAADDLVAQVERRDHRRNPHQAGCLKGPFDHLGQPLQVERLDEVVERPLLHRLNGGLRRAVRGDEQDLRLRQHPPQLAQQFQPGPIRQLQVEDDDLRRMLARQFQTFRRRRAGHDLRLVRRKDAAEGVTHAFFVVDDQQRSHGVSP
jgi:hypothetical protein